MHDGKAPLLSIIVPVYGVEKYVERCVDSILKQTYRNIEVILVDDGSPDRCPEICDAFAAKDTRIKVIHQENAGLSAARNAGIDSASGDFIGFIDGDDWINADMYEVLYGALVTSGADMSICNERYVGEDESYSCDNSSPPIKDEVLTGTDTIVKKLSAGKNWYWVSPCNKLFRRDLFADIRYPLGKLHEDEFVIHKLLLKCSKVACISDTLYNYLQRKSSITKNRYSIGRLDSAEAHFERAEMFLSKGVCAHDAYYACSVGLRVMANSYTQMDFRDPHYKARYNELSGQYRIVAKKLVRADLPFGIKARLVLNRVSPFYTWKLIERFMRRIKGEPLDSANEARANR